MRKGNVFFIHQIMGWTGVYTDYSGRFFQDEAGISITNEEREKEMFIPWSNIKNIVYGV